MGVSEEFKIKCLASIRGAFQLFGANMVPLKLEPAI